MGKSRRARHLTGFKKGHVTISPVKERNLKTIASLWNSGYVSKAALFYIIQLPGRVITEDLTA